MAGVYRGAHMTAYCEARVSHGAGQCTSDNNNK